MSPPGPILQKINQLLHREPLETLVHTFYWGIILIFICPFAGLIHLCTFPIKLLWLANRKNIDVSKRELGVLITGCDSGFGSDLAWELQRKGFVIFAGCLTEDGMKQFKGEKFIIPIQMNVTKIDQISAAATVVNDWISDEEQRVLHAVVNNAGKGLFTSVDWMDNSSVEGINRMTSDMDVNFYGMVHTIKSMLPFLKQQVFAKSYKDSRIINVSSMAGLTGGLPGASMYCGSKFAVEGFSYSLRMELAPFGIDVVNVNPSFHKTDLCTTVSSNLQLSWEKLRPEIREEYGEPFQEKLSRYLIQTSTSYMWDRSVVIDKLVESVVLKNPPCQYIIGSDAKYVLLLVHWLPRSFISYLVKKDSGIDDIILGSFKN